MLVLSLIKTMCGVKGGVTPFVVALDREIESGRYSRKAYLRNKKATLVGRKEQDKAQKNAKKWGKKKQCRFPCLAFA